MARKKKEEGGGGGSPAWMATFSDLMNLLLCFFVLLFAFSSVDAEKFAEIAASFNSSYSIFSGGSQAIGEGHLISQGVSQMDYLSEYYNEMGVEAGSSEFDGETETGEDSQNIAENEAQPENSTSEAAQEGSTGEKSQDALEEYKEQLAKKQRENTENLYEEISDAADEKNLEDMIAVSMDSDYQYVQISLSGAILFDSGKADLKKEAKPILKKLGTILKTYDKYVIKIEGHTDNVPIKNNKYGSNMWLSTARAIQVFEYLTEECKLDPKTLEASGRGEYEPIASNNSTEGRAKNRRVEVKIYSSIPK